RTTREHGSRRTPASFPPAIISRRAAPASRPSASRFMSTLVSGGRVASVITSQLSKPTTATSVGTARPITRRASIAPRAIWSLPQKSASGAPFLGERCAIALVAQADRLEPLRPRNGGDSPASQRGKAPDCELGAALVVGKQAERVGVFHAGEHVDHRQSAHGRLNRFAPVDAPRRHDDSVNAFAKQLLDVPP